MAMTETVRRTDAYLDAFRQSGKDLSVAQAPWLGELRRRAIAAFEARGFPTSKDEDWKYTSLGGLAETRFRRVVASASTPPTTLHRDPFAALGAHRIVLVDGRFNSALSQPPPGLHADSLAQVLRDRPDAVAPHLGKIANAETNPFTALNTALFEDGVHIDVPRGWVGKDTVNIVHVTTQATQPTVAHPRTLVTVGENAEASLIETFVDETDGVHFTNPVTEVRLGPGSRLDHYRLQHEGPEAYHIGTLAVAQGRDSRYANLNASLGGRLARLDVDVDFQAPGGDATLNGLYVVAGNQHVDNHTRVDHRAPHCTSREYYKGILDEESSGVFYGKVFIHKDAQKSDASQSNKNLLLSTKALANSTPALEIHADDVKAAHGSTTGQLDKDAVFYLRSRGIDLETARSVLTFAFARDVLTRVRAEPVRAQLEEALFTRLPNGEAVREALQ